MSAEEKGPDSALDRTISEIRNEAIDPAVVSRAAERAWARITDHLPAAPAESDALRTCADFQALIPALRAGRLTEARALLVRDHTRECPACRKALWQAKQPELPRKPGPAVSQIWRWAAAAAVFAAVGLSAVLIADRLLPAPAGARASVQVVDGVLYRVVAGASSALAAGAEIAESEGVRTAKNSGAVIRLRDGSLIELAERTELSVSERRQGATVRLERGSIIVRAAEQRSRQLYVATEDLTVAVTGTIFSVNHGMKGSRVSVFDGEVRVSQGKQKTVLRPGEQLAANMSVAPVALQEEIAWSRNVDDYIALVKDLSTLRQKLEAMPGPGLRYSSRLIELAPDGTAFYVSIPNVAGTIAEANRIFQEQLGQSPALREWWAQKMNTPENQAKFEEMLARLRAFGDYLGSEIVVAIPATPGGGHAVPLLLAEVTRDGLRAYLEQELSKLGGTGVRFIDDPLAAAPSAPREELLVFISGGNLVAASPDLALLQQVAVRILRPGSGAFQQSEFHARIAEAYRNGVGWLFCADVQSLVPADRQDEKDREQYRRSGVGDLRYLIAEHKEVAGQAENRAMLTFSQPRRGVASWLAAPGPMRVLDFVSPDATFATAFVVKNPALLVEDVFAMMEASGPAFWSDLAAFEAKTGLNVRTDLAQPLGGEFAFAVDGPLLPQPSWKLVLEIYDPARFQQALEKLVAAANREAADRERAEPMRIDREQAGTQTFHVLRGLKAGLEAHYIFHDGFLIAAANRDLLARALQYRAAGYTLPRSAKFAALVPQDRHTNFSAVVYHSLGSLAPLAERLLTPEQQKSLEGLASTASPTLVLAYGGQDRIEIASRGSLFGLSLEHLFGLHGSPRIERHKGRRPQWSAKS